MSAPAEQKTVLVVDDENFSRRLAVLLLERAGFRALTAVNGEEALLLAKVQRPDVILLDLIMPKMGGHEALRHLKDDPVLHATPVIVVTAKAAEQDIAASFRLGAAFHLEKPYETMDLLSKIHAALTLAEAHQGPQPAA